MLPLHFRLSFFDKHCLECCRECQQYQRAFGLWTGQCSGYRCTNPVDRRYGKKISGTWKGDRPHFVNQAHGAYDSYDWWPNEDSGLLGSQTEQHWYQSTCARKNMTEKCRGESGEYHVKKLPSESRVFVNEKTSQLQAHRIEEKGRYDRIPNVYRVAIQSFKLAAAGMSCVILSWLD